MARWTSAGSVSTTSIFGLLFGETESWQMTEKSMLVMVSGVTLLMVDLSVS
jgi:hypothetical protein